MTSPTGQNRNGHGDTPGDARTDDSLLASHLARALRAEADGVSASPDAWQAFLSRAGAPRVAGTPRATAGIPRRGGNIAARWRFPLIAAAAVAAIALAATAIVTGGFGATAQAPAAGRHGGAAATGSTVGTSSERSIVCPQAPPAAVAVPVVNAPATAAHSLRMGFAGGKPPVAALCGIVGSGSPPAGGSAVASDGTALGYLSLPGDMADKATYLWGAVGPDVALLQVTAVLAPTADDPHPSFALATQWTFGPARAAAAARATTDPGAVGWTDLGSGWHGIALQLPANTRTITESATGPSGATVQSQSVDVATGHTSPLNSPRSASVAATAPPTAMPTGTLLIAASDDPCATVPDGRGEIRADDEGTPVLAHLDKAGTALCFSDGSGWYSAKPVTGPNGSLLRFFGVTGAEPTVDPADSTRLVFGLIGADATRVTATRGIEQVGPLHPLPGTDLRLVVLRAGRASGFVTVSDSAGHQVTRPVKSLG